jgi:hypothetical protein
MAVKDPRVRGGELCGGGQIDRHDNIVGPGVKTVLNESDAACERR